MAKDGVKEGARNRRAEASLRDEGRNGIMPTGCLRLRGMLGSLLGQRAKPGEKMSGKNKPNQNRERLFNLIQARPGLGVRDAGRRAGIALGAMAYHVERLEMEGRISSVRFQGRRLLFPHKAPQGRELAERIVLEDPHLFALHEWVRRNGPVAQQGILNHFPEPRATVQHRLGRLIRHGLIEARVQGRARIYGVTA